MKVEAVQRKADGTSKLDQLIFHNYETWPVTTGEVEKITDTIYLGKKISHATTRNQS